MILTDQTGKSHELNDICNANFLLGLYFGNRYFSEKNAKVWKSKITHFCKNSGIFRERIKDVSGQGFTYKLAQILPDGKIQEIDNLLTTAYSLEVYKQLTATK
jgi:hypothetical protein